MKKLTEARRAKAAMLLIEELAANAGLMEPVDSPAFKAFAKVYEMAHVINLPKCRKNHHEWTRELDADAKKMFGKGRRAKATYTAKEWLETIAEEECKAEISHGPGHQSRSTCDIKGPHKQHANYSMGLYWSKKGAFSGFFDESPEDQI